MVLYDIKWRKSDQKELYKIDKQSIPKILIAIEKLAKAPAPKNSKKLRGRQYTYRIRVGIYCIIYSIENDILLIEVIKVGHRNGIYN